jgi:hypothetical protein
MSLLDALLENELMLPALVGGSPSVPAREIWICIRSDGAIGSGSQDNPYDGGTRK